MAANSVVGDGVWQKVKVIQAFMVVLDTCKNDEDSSKNESTRGQILFYEGVPKCSNIIIG